MTSYLLRPTKIIFLSIIIVVLLLESNFFAAEKPKQKNSGNYKLKPFSKNIKQKPLPFNFPKTETKNPVIKEEKVGLTVGIKAGGSAGLRGALGDVSYSLNKLVPGASIRGSVGYLTGSTNINTSADDIKLALVNLDAVYNIENLISQDSPFKVYLGGGFIYPVKVNKNRGEGAWGAHAYLGSKYLLQDNTSIYGELSYSGIKYQANEAALRGVEAMMGYSYSF